MASLLDAYLATCQRAGEAPAPEILRALEQAGASPPSEAGEPFAGIPEEVALYARVGRYWAETAGVSPADREARTARAAEVQARLRAVEEALASPLSALQPVADALEALARLQPPYPRRRQLVSAAVLPALARGLLGLCSRELTGVLRDILPGTLELLVSLSVDPNFKAFSQEAEAESGEAAAAALGDLRRIFSRGKFLSDYTAAAGAIVRCVPRTEKDLMALSVPRDFFIAGQDQFEKHKGALAHALAPYERQAGRFLLPILRRLGPETVGQLLPLLSDMRGLFTRPAIRAEMRSGSFDTVILDALLEFDRALVQRYETGAKPSSGEDIPGLILDVRQARQTAQSCAAAARPIVGEHQRYKEVSQALASTVAQLKEREAALVREARGFLLLDFRAVQEEVARHNGLYALRFDPSTGRLLAGFPPELRRACTLVSSLAALSCDPGQMGLPQELLNAVDVASRAEQHILALENVASFYNSLSQTIRGYQKPLLLEYAAGLERELKRAGASSLVNPFLPPSTDPARSPVAKLQQVATHIEGVAAVFRRSVELLEDFHAFGMARLSEFAGYSLSSQRPKWEAAIGALRERIAGLKTALRRQDMPASVVQYWTGALAKVVAVKYARALSTDLTAIRPLARPIQMSTQTIRLSPSPSAVCEYITAQVNEIARLPMDPVFLLFDEQEATAGPQTQELRAVLQRMRELSVDFLPAAVASAREVAGNLERVEQFFRRECAVVLLAHTGADKECAEKVRTLEECQELVSYSQRAMAETQSPEALVAASLPFLLESAQGKGIFSVLPSKDTIFIDLNNCLRLLHEKPRALQDVAIAAAAYQAEQLSGDILGVVSEFSHAFDANLSALSTSKEFSEASRQFSTMAQRMESELQGKCSLLQRYEELLNLGRQQREYAVRLLEKASTAFDALQTRMSNMSAELDSRKENLREMMRETVEGSSPTSLCARARTAGGDLSDCLGAIAAYCRACISVRKDAADADANLFFRGLYGGSQSCLGSHLERARGALAELEAVGKELGELDAEASALYGQRWQDLATPEHQAEIRAALDSASPAQAFLPVLEEAAGLEAQAGEFQRLDWGSLRSRLGQLDTLSAAALALQGRIAGLALPDTEMPLGEAQRALGTYMRFLGALGQAAAPVFKGLRSQALARSHFVELADRTGLAQAARAFSEDPARAVSQLPESLSGAAVLHAVAASLYCVSNLQTLEQILRNGVLSQEYKKLLALIRETVTKAENEATVRSAVDEASFWLNNEARVTFTTLELSAASRSECADIQAGTRGLGLAAVPLSANWKQTLTGVVEKKAVLLSVASNPYAKALRDQIDDCLACIEAVTRLAHVLSTIGRQIGVLEPVMGRRVLPDEHRRFYDAFRVVCALLLREAPDEGADVCLGARGPRAAAGEGGPGQAEVTLQVSSILHTDVPGFAAAMRQHPTRQAERGAVVDNTSLGPYADVILALELASALLSEVQLSLRKYLEEKRISFPRLFFLADGDVLEILANASSSPEKTLAPHIKKLFGAVEALEYRPGEEAGLPAGSTAIVGFRSPEGERVRLSKAVCVTQDLPPELWLGRLEYAISQTLKGECLGALGLSFSPRDVNSLGAAAGPSQAGGQVEIPAFVSSHVEVRKSVSPLSTGGQSFYTVKDLSPVLKQQLDIAGLSGEMLCVIFGVLFTAQVDYTVYHCAGNEEAYKKALASVSKRLDQYMTLFSEKLFSPEISTASFGTAQYTTMLKLKGLATDTSHYQTVLRLLGAETHAERRKWIWARELKYRVHRASGDVYVCSIDAVLPYTFEYQGLASKLIHTPLTDRCYNTLTEAIALSLGGLPAGPAGTGKTETVKMLASKLGRGCIVFNCDGAIVRQDLTRILVGLVLSGFFSSFDEFNRLSPAVLSAVSTDIEAVQSAILRRATGDVERGAVFSLGGLSVPYSKVSPFAGAFLTMNPASREYRGRSELPYSLLRLMRGCHMGRADVSLIMETVLGTSGFTSAKELAEQADMVYVLCSRRIPKEVHLDWGLRSLQAVLRQAALARASAQRALRGKALSDGERHELEQSAMIKALSDATFSRVVGTSRAIFMEILTDVFGSKPVSHCLATSKAFGAASLPEERFVSHYPKGLDKKTGELGLQLYRALVSKMGVALLGNTCSGKSRILDLVKDTIAASTDGNIVVREVRIAPKSMSRQDLLGFVDPQTGEWTDGALTKAARQAVALIGNTSERPLVWPFIVFDGLLDPEWVEALNSVLDDNRLLTLSSGERIRFPISQDPIDAYCTAVASAQAASGGKGVDPARLPLSTPISFVLELDSVKHASPATVSRLAVILVPDPTKEDVLAAISGASAGLPGASAQFGRMAADLLQSPAFEQLGATLGGSGMSFSEVAFNLYYGGLGEAAGVPEAQKQQAFAVGAVRALFSIFGTVSQGTRASLDEATLQALASAAAGGQGVGLRGTAASPGLAPAPSASRVPPQLVWGSRLLRSFFAAGRHVILSGERCVGKHTALRAAAAGEGGAGELAPAPAAAGGPAGPAGPAGAQAFRVVSYSCSQLTTRADIVQLVTSRCVEYQAPDGERVLRPRGEGGPLLFSIRDVDAVSLDSYGHSPLLGLFWGVVAHDRLFIRPGQSVRLEGVFFALGVASLGAVTPRLRRRMGVANFGTLGNADSEAILGGVYQSYALLRRVSGLERWKNEAIGQAESAAIRLSSQPQAQVAALPTLLASVASYDLATMSTICRLVRRIPALGQPDRLSRLVSYFVECAVPYFSGREIARADAKHLVSSGQPAGAPDAVLTFSRRGVTAQAVARGLGSSEPIELEIPALDGGAGAGAVGAGESGPGAPSAGPAGPAPAPGAARGPVDLVPTKARLGLAQELLRAAVDHYPGLRLFSRFLEEIADTPLAFEYCKLISALEFALYGTGGAFLVAQPNLFSAEAAAVAALTLGYEIVPAPAEVAGSAAVRSLAERVAAGFTKVALFVDTGACEADPQWVPLLSALASRDALYFRSRLSLADLRSLLSRYQERCPPAGEVSEDAAISEFLQVVAGSVAPVILCNPERRASDRLFSMAPALRRTYRVVSLPILAPGESPAPGGGALRVEEAVARVLGGKGSAEPAGSLVSRTTEAARTFYRSYRAPGELPAANMYTRVHALYALFRREWERSLDAQQRRLAGGLSQLRAAQEEVDRLALDARRSFEKVERSQEAANRAIEEITRKMASTSQRSREADEVRKELMGKEEVILENKRKADEELKSVKPILEEATRAVSTIPPDALTEIKSFNNPPTAVAVVLEAVLGLMGQKDVSWKGMRAFLSQSGVLRSITGLDVRSVSKQRLSAVEAVMKKNPQCFDQEQIRKVSRAAAPLAAWVTATFQYLKVFAKVEPLVQAAEKADRQLREQRENLERIGAEIKELEAQTAVLREDFNKKTQILMQYKAELEQIEKKKQTGEDMLAGLRGERERWEASERETAQKLRVVDSCALQCAQMLVLAGNFTDDVREQAFGGDRATFDSMLYTDAFASLVTERGLHVGRSGMEAVAALDRLFFGTGADPAAKPSEGPRSIFNAVIFSHATEGTGIYAYLRHTGATFVSAAAENLGNMVAIAARFGKAIVVTDCDGGTLPAPLIPYLRYGQELYRAEGGAPAEPEQDEAPGGVRLDAGLVLPPVTVSAPLSAAKSGEVHPGFRLVVLSSVAIQVPSDLSPRALTLSLAPTQKSRSDMYVDAVLSAWSPSTLRRLQELRQRQADLRLKLQGIEDVLLGALAGAAGSGAPGGAPGGGAPGERAQTILEDERLIRVLREARAQAEEIQRGVEETRKAEGELDEVRGMARTIADSVNQCMSTLDALGSLNSLYVADDNTVLPLLNGCLRESSGPITEERVRATIARFHAVTYRRLQSMVFSEDRIAASALLLKNYRPDLFTPEVFSFFTGLGSGAGCPCPSWVPAAKKAEFQRAVACLPNAKVSRLDLANAGVWAGFASAASGTGDVSAGVFPPHAQAVLNPLERVVLLGALRPDLLVNLLYDACDEAFTAPLRESGSGAGAEAASGSAGGAGSGPASSTASGTAGEASGMLAALADPLGAALALSAGLSQPIIIYTSAGQDPTTNLKIDRVVAISPGREAEADEQLRAALDECGADLPAGAREASAGAAGGSVSGLGLDSASGPAGRAPQLRKRLVVIKGAHLCVDWLGSLPAKLLELSAYCGDTYGSLLPAQSLSVALLLEPKPFFPKSLSRISWRLCFSQASSPKGTMLSSLSSAVVGALPALAGSAAAKKVLAILFSLSALHATLENRKSYAPRGVAADPGWSQNDMAAVAKIVVGSTTGNCDVTRSPEGLDAALLGLSERLNGVLCDSLYGVSTKDESDLTLVRTILRLCMHQGVLKEVFKRLDSGERPPTARSVSENLRALGSAPTSKLADAYPVLAYFLPPVHVLAREDSPDRILAGFTVYVESAFPDKATPDFLALPMNALSAKGERDALFLSSLLMRSSLGSGGSAGGAGASSGAPAGGSGRGAGTGVYDQILALQGVYSRHVEAKLSQARQKVSAAGSSSSPIAQELAGQGELLYSVAAQMEADFAEAKVAAGNYLLASTRIKQIASLVASNLTPEVWCGAVASPPTATAPHDAPELATLQPGSPEGYVRFLAESMRALVAGADSAQQKGEIRLDLHLLPRPAAVVEAVRRHEGAVEKTELNRVSLVAVAGEGFAAAVAAKAGRPLVTLSAKSCVLEGCEVRADRLDFSRAAQELPAIYLCPERLFKDRAGYVQVPFYVDRMRTARMAVVPSLFIEGGARKDAEKAVSLNGLYAHLAGR